MRYLGGKSRTAKQIAGYIHTVIKPGQAYYEPFCGACWVTCEVHAERRFASDANAGMIALWQALQEGWIPPSEVSEDEHAAAKQGAYADQPHLEAFILVGMSYGGVWGAGYSRDFPYASYYPQLAAYNGCMTKVPHLKDVQFSTCYYQDIQPEPNSLIYCDPPYDETTGYGAVGEFDSAAFWEWAQGMAEEGHTVIVSEYNAPAGWACVVDMPLQTKSNGGKRQNRIERLFRYGQHERLQPIMPGFEMVMA